MRPRRLVAVGVLLALAGGLLAAPAFLGGADEPTVDQQKQAAIDEALRHPYVEPEIGIGSIEPFSDVGPPEIVAAVKHAAVRNVEINESLDELPIDLDERAEQIRDPEAKADRLARITRAWASSRVADVERELEESFVRADGRVDYYPYQDVEFVVTSWEGVRVEGNTAFALPHGHLRLYRDYRDDDGWADDPDAQWQIDLVLEGGDWKLVYAGEFLDGESY